MSDKILIRVGHSPDPDDAFMFHALANDKIDTGRYRFTHELQDIETLNQPAFEGELELTAVSLHGYAYVTEQVCLVRLRRQHGRQLRADGRRPQRGRHRLAPIDRQIAIPGELTTAFLTLRLLLGDHFTYEVQPFDQILDVVAQRKVDAGLIIHEGQLTYDDQGLSLIVDLGKWWHDETGLPLPLGGNAIRKDLGPAGDGEVTALLKQSIQYGLDHRQRGAGPRPAIRPAISTLAKADSFVGMYVNDWTLDFGPRGREAVATLLRRGFEEGIIPRPVDLEFIGCRHVCARLKSVWPATKS